MKKQLRYRNFTIAIGIVVALLIVLTLWIQTEIPAAPKAKASGEVTFAVKPLIQLFSRIEVR